MMFYASAGIRNVARKGSNAVVHHGGHNGAGGSTTASSTRSIHVRNLGLHPHGALHAPQPVFNQPTLAQIRPRNPAHQLFSTSKNLLQRFFTHLTAPGLRAPTYLSDLAHAGSRSLYTPSLQRATFQNGLSLPVRTSLRNSALQRQANTFLPRGPGPAPPRCGGVAQLGLGTARNFSTGRPIFQNLVQNVPVAMRALYEVDMDLESKQEVAKLRAMKFPAKKEAKKAVRQALKPINKDKKLAASVNQSEDSTPVKVTTEEINHYFPTEVVAPVTTYLLIPLAPTPTGRIPLPPDVRLSGAPNLLPPLPYIGAVHASHSTHALRVSSLFTRLDQADVWTRGGVSCNAYSQGSKFSEPRNIIKDDESDILDEGVCTVLKVEFVGWSKAEVRGVIGESGTGWCVLEEVRQDDEESLSFPSSQLSSPSSMSSANLAIEEEDDSLRFGDAFAGPRSPGESVLVMPTLDFSAEFATASRTSSPGASLNTFVNSDADAWADIPSSPYATSSASSSFSDLSELIIDPPSMNGWFGSGSGLGLGFSSEFESRRSSEVEPQEGMFY